MIDSATIKEIMQVLAPGDRVYCRLDGPVTVRYVTRVLPDGVLTEEGELLFSDYQRIWWLTPIGARKEKSNA